MRRRTVDRALRIGSAAENSETERLGRLGLSSLRAKTADGLKENNEMSGRDIGVTGVGV